MSATSSQRASITRGNGVTTTYSYDGAQRLSSLAHDLASTGSDQTLSYTYAASNQQLTHTGTNSSYVYTPPNGYTYAPVNGGNRITSVNAATATYDTRGNLTSDGTTSYAYEAYNRMTAAGSATLNYDPAGRLNQTAGAATTRFLYDGSEAIAEYNSSGTMLRRFVHGPGIDEPIVWYEGTGTSDRRWLVQNEQNSVIAVTDGSGAALNINTYDEYGVPGAANAGRFQYTGQMWLSEAGLYSYKAREYSAALGRFMQTDPIGQAGGLNIYAYVGGDPVNWVDPSGHNPLLAVIFVGGCAGGMIAQTIAETNDGIVGVSMANIGLGCLEGVGAAALTTLAALSSAEFGPVTAFVAGTAAVAWWHTAVFQPLYDQNNIGRVREDGSVVGGNLGTRSFDLASVGTSPSLDSIPGAYWERLIRDPNSPEGLILVAPRISRSVAQAVVNMLFYGVPSMPDLIPGGFGAAIMRQFLMTPAEAERERIRNYAPELMRLSRQ